MHYCILFENKTDRLQTSYAFFSLSRRYSLLCNIMFIRSYTIENFRRQYCFNFVRIIFWYKKCILMTLYSHIINNSSIMCVYIFFIKRNFKTVKIYSENNLNENLRATPLRYYTILMWYDDSLYTTTNITMNVLSEDLRSAVISQYSHITIVKKQLNFSTLPGTPFFCNFKTKSVRQILTSPSFSAYLTT